MNVEMATRALLLIPTLTLAAAAVIPKTDPAVPGDVQSEISR